MVKVTLAQNLGLLIFFNNATPLYLTIIFPVFFVFVFNSYTRIHLTDRIYANTKMFLFSVVNVMYMITFILL